MRAPLSWLRDFAPLDAPVERLVSSLSQLGLVVDGVSRVGSRLDGVVVARVAGIRPHPDADRIRLVDVDAGGPDCLQVVCGAWNFDEGDLVPLATVGTVLPGGMEIGRRKMRGQASEGMLCSPPEVDLPGDPGGLLVLPAGLAPPGTPLAEALELIEDVVFDLDITPNRPDALSMVGVARDLAAVLGEELRLPSVGASPRPPAGAPPTAGVAVLAPDLCPRFTATVVAGVPTGPSPAWMARRLTLAGMRPINAVVDASNYVMLELGQPNHPYDLDRLPGGGLIVRRARGGETLVTLDGVTRHLEADDCLICDAEDQPVGIGGIMGGAAAEIGPQTRTVVLEAAWFSPQAVARTGKRLGLATEARARFERGVDPTVAPVAVERFVTLLGGEAVAGPTVDVSSPEHLPATVTVPVRTARVNGLLGTDLDDEHVGRLLGSIGFSVAPVADGVSEVVVPPWRPDVAREVDVVEEVGRLFGYFNIERTLPAGVRASGGLTPYQRQRRRVRDILAGAGLSEAWTTTFLAPGDLERAGLPGAAVEVENPLAESESILRTSLLPGLLKAVRYNADRQWPDVALFEVGRVFLPPADGQSLPVELELVGAIAAGEGVDARTAVRSWTALAAALRLAGVRLSQPAYSHPGGATRGGVGQAGADGGGDGPATGRDGGVPAETSAHPAVTPGFHPSRSAAIVGAGGDPLGAVGEVDPDAVAAFGLSGRVAFWWVDLERLLAEPRRSDQAVPVSRFPGSDVDLAFVVPGDVAAAEVAACLREAAADIESVSLFDVYPMPASGPGARSLAFRLRFRAAERTLTDAEVAAGRQAAIDAVAGAYGARLRG
ncbi:MAG TPA: phenylalanine--tRNA ligase subunit beta [Acidimicrobiales bacterium]|nr:phenylalanine--tRNA ligase subunit beta [Acidimicrobiales bacterium]